jgi:hypothetical protein
MALTLKRRKLIKRPLLDGYRKKTEELYEEQQLAKKKEQESLEPDETLSEKEIEDLFEAKVFLPGVNPWDLPPYEIYEPDSYRDGPEGFIKWCEDHVAIPIYPVGSTMAVWCPISKLPRVKNPSTGRSYWEFWDAQKEVVRECLRMINGQFIYRLIILCWMRGEGKSLLACLIQLWKFFNWTKQQIVLGANSKEQVTFVHFDIMRDIILNSPTLQDLVGKRNIQERRIMIKDESNNIVSVIRSISSFSGIVSNITGYTFSEIFDMRKPTFFVQLDGSIRNIPNALGVIDSTVSSKQHILYNLFDGYVTRKSKTVYFSYRFSAKANHEDYWNPNMTQDQLDDYSAKFPMGDFERYFKNTWGSASEQVFTDEMIQGIGYMGIDGVLGNNQVMMEAITRKVEVEQQMRMLIERRAQNRDLNEERGVINKVVQRLIPVEKYYTLKDKLGMPVMATLQDLEMLGGILDTNWAILAGIDRADPMKVSNRGARTIFTCMAKGLPGSKSKPMLFQSTDTPGQVPSYIYLLLNLVHVESHSLEDLKNLILDCKEEFDGVDILCGERWGIWDLQPWCEDEEIKFEAVFPTYDKQKAAFSEFYLLSREGRFKAPPMAVMGSKEMDMLREEMKYFFHDADKHWFGSPEKNERGGVQDDAIFCASWTVYGGRELNATDFKERRQTPYFGTMIMSNDHLGPR